MPVFTALTTLTSRENAHALGLSLENLEDTPSGVGVFEMEDGSGLWEVGAYFEFEPDDIALAILAVAHEAKPFVVSEVPETDWVAHVRRELHPVEAGRFFVYGSHDADKVPEGRVSLLIEAAMAFGTGHHGTTQGCLEALDRLITAGEVKKNTVDIGCGTAVLAMAAAKTWPESVMASDIDEVAVEVAEANVLANNLAGRVTCLEAAGFDHAELSAKAPYDLIFANILKGPLVELAPDIASHTAAGGHVILSGLLNEQANDVKAAYKAEGFSVEHHAELGEWSTLTLRR